MNKPVENPEFISFWQITAVVHCKIMLVINPDQSSTGFFNSENEAQHAMLVEKLMNPDKQYFIHEISYPFNMKQKE